MPPLVSVPLRAIVGVLVSVLVAGQAFGDAASEGEKLRRSGRYRQAEQLLGSATQKDPRAFAARLSLGLVYRATGQREKERAVWNRFYDDYEAGVIDKKKSKELLYVALAARYLGGWQDANDTFRDAVAADPKGKDGARANVAWAALFLDKYDAGHAELSLTEALAVLPRDADAHALLARVKKEQNDAAGAEREIAAALAADPGQVDALDLRGEMLIEDERWADALAAAKAALAVNPEDVGAHTIVAAAAFLRGDERGYDAERSRVLAVNPHAWQLDHGVAEFLVKQHRYLEANRLEEAALAVEPKSEVALAALGSNWLRLGEDAKGLAALREAWKRDHYNVRTYNLLNLYEEVIAKEYVLVPGTPFRFRVSLREEKALVPVVAPLVTREYEELRARYGFTPAGPLTIELYADPEHYAVRTVGLPGLEALGVTFGKVVTGMSPQGGRFNWGMMLWHEVAHIFALQMSKARVPRWFTEGLSEYETWRADPSWQRRTHAELYRALADGTLASVRDLDAGFAHARDVAHMVVAYHQAAEEVMFLVRRFGFPPVVAALKLFAAGKTTAEVIPAVTGLEVKAFDAAFAADLRARLTPYQDNFFVRGSDFSDVEALEKALKERPGDGRARGLVALALLHAQKGEAAQRLLDEAPRGEVGETRELVLAQAMLALAQKDRARAGKLAAALAALPHGDGYDARLLLGKVAADDGRVEDAARELALAASYDPNAADPYLILGKLLLGRDPERAAKALEKAAELEVMDGAIPKMLVAIYEKRGRNADLVHAAKLALDIDPYDVGVRAALARALYALGRAADARADIDLALACSPTEKERATLLSLRREARAPRPAPR